MEWIPNDEEKSVDEVIIDQWFIPGIDHEVDFSVYRNWSNDNKGKKATPY